MARRRSVSRSMPLEWKTVTTQVTDTTGVSPTTQSVDLDLLPDEIAEIWKIDSTIDTGSIGELDNNLDVASYLSMDPDASASPRTLSNLRDLEVFFTHIAAWEFLLTTTGVGLSPMFDSKIVSFAPHPILVGTNLGHVLHSESTVDVTIDQIITVYFKRRRATASELNQILLKRR